MSLRNKRSSSSLAPTSRQSLLSHNDYASVAGDKQQSIDHKIEKQIRRVSTLFHRSKTEDGPFASTNSSHQNSSSNFGMGSTSPEIPLPQSLNSGSLYSLKNTSSGTLVSRQHSLDNHFNNGNGINNVEFTNIRTGPDFYDGTDSIHSPSSASFVEKTKETKLGRFLTKTGNKVKKFSDMSGDQINLGLGLHGHGGIGHNHSFGYNHNHNHNHGFPELNLQGSFLSVGSNSKDLKSPITRGFKGDQKLSFGEKLKLLNSTKYKNYHYHNILRNKKESLKNGIKLGSKNNDLTHGHDPNNNMAGSSYALYDINYVELERMIANDVLNFEQCDLYCKFLYDRLQNLLIPMFRGETLQSSLEDTTKLVGLYVRLRKAQEGGVRETEKNNHKSTDNAANAVSNGGNTAKNNKNGNSSFGIGHSQSQNSLNSLKDYGDFSTPFMKPSATFSNSPMTTELNSPTAFSPLIKIRSSSFIAISKVLEEINEILKHGMSVMVNQLYYDETNDTIRFIRGSNPMLRKRKNTVGYANEDGMDNLHHTPTSSTFNNNLNSASSNAYNLNNDNDTTVGKSSNSLYAIDMGVNSSTRSVADLPILTPTHTYNSYDVRQGDIWDGANDMYNGYGHELNDESDILNLSSLLVGKFEKCTSVLWDIFQRNLLFDLTSILLPVELEFANGHRDISKIHTRANSILYNRGEKLVSFTNTMVYPDISGHATGGAGGGGESGIGNSIIGSLGEWGDINIRNVLLVGFRDFVVIPLYEMNRQFEDVDGVGVDVEPRTVAGDKPVDKSVDKSADKSTDKSAATTTPAVLSAASPAAAAAAGVGARADASLVQEYTDACVLLQCFRLVSSVGTNDTNQKLVENLLVQMRDRCHHYESILSQ